MAASHPTSVMAPVWRWLQPSVVVEAIRALYHHKPKSQWQFNWVGKFFQLQSKDNEYQTHYQLLAFLHQIAILLEDCWFYAGMLYRFDAQMFRYLGQDIVWLRSELMPGSRHRAVIESNRASPWMLLWSSSSFTPQYCTDDLEPHTVLWSIRLRSLLEDEQSQFISSACFRGSHFLAFSALKRLFWSTHVENPSIDSFEVFYEATERPWLSTVRILAQKGAFFT